MAGFVQPVAGYQAGGSPAYQAPYAAYSAAAYPAAVAPAAAAVAAACSAAAAPAAEAAAAYPAAVAPAAVPAAAEEGSQPLPTSQPPAAAGSDAAADQVRSSHSISMTLVHIAVCGAGNVWHHSRTSRGPGSPVIRVLSSCVLHCWTVMKTTFKHWHQHDRYSSSCK